MVCILTSGITSAGFSFFLPFLQNNINATRIIIKMTKETDATTTVSNGLVSEKKKDNKKN